MWCDGIFTVIKEYFDSGQCLDRVCEINKTDRWFDFAHFKKTAKYCVDQMKRIGLEEVDMLALNADGATAYGDWVAPKAWDASGAVLDIVPSGWEI